VLLLGYCPRRPGQLLRFSPHQVYPFSLIRILHCAGGGGHTYLGEPLWWAGMTTSMFILRYHCALHYKFVSPTEFSYCSPSQSAARGGCKLRRVRLCASRTCHSSWSTEHNSEVHFSAHFFFWGGCTLLCYFDSPVLLTHKASETAQFSAGTLCAQRAA
jgi:hypothetical protein